MTLRTVKKAGNLLATVLYLVERSSLELNSQQRLALLRSRTEMATEDWHIDVGT